MLQGDVSTEILRAAYSAFENQNPSTPITGPVPPIKLLPNAIVSGSYPDDFGRGVAFVNIVHPGSGTLLHAVHSVPFVQRRPVAAEGILQEAPVTTVHLGQYRYLRDSIRCLILRNPPPEVLLAFLDFSEVRLVVGSERADDLQSLPFTPSELKFDELTGREKCRGDVGDGVPVVGDVDSAFVGYRQVEVVQVPESAVLPRVDDRAAQLEPEKSE